MYFPPLFSPLISPYPQQSFTVGWIGKNYIGWQLHLGSKRIKISGEIYALYNLSRFVFIQGNKFWKIPKAVYSLIESTPQNRTVEKPWNTGWKRKAPSMTNVTSINSIKKKPALLEFQWKKKQNLIAWVYLVQLRIKPVSFNIAVTLEINSCDTLVKNKNYPCPFSFSRVL